MKYAATKNICNHLEFLGYEIEELKGKNEIEIVLATHESKPNIMMAAGEQDTFFQTTWTGIDIRANKSKEFFETLNQANADTNICAVYYERVDDNKSINVLLKCTYPGYNKKEFGQFFIKYENDNQLVINAMKPFYE